MADKDTGGAAFPSPSFTRSGHPNGHSMGMTFRNWVAGQCIAAAFGGDGVVITREDGETADDALKRYWAAVAHAAAIAADAMVEALNG